jgi:hypothetical protein
VNQNGSLQPKKNEVELEMHTPLIQRLIPQNLGSFGTNYIFFRNAEILGNYFFLKENMFL